MPGVNANILNNLQVDVLLEHVEFGVGNAMKELLSFRIGLAHTLQLQSSCNSCKWIFYPKFVEWGKQGEVGRRKLNQATRYISLVLAFVQSIGITAGFNTLSQVKLVATSTIPRPFY